MKNSTGNGWSRYSSLPRRARTVVLALSQVITPRKLAEAAIRRREQEFRTLVENSSDIIARYDLELRCQFINRSVSRYSPLIRDEHIGKT
jgi:PAS domain-containing protein